MSRTKISQIMHEVASLPVTGANMSTTVNCAQDIIYIKKKNESVDMHAVNGGQ
jgi:hypothetical protein